MTQIDGKDIWMRKMRQIRYKKRQIDRQTDKSIEEKNKLDRQINRQIDRQMNGWIDGKKRDKRDEIDR